MSNDSSDLSIRLTDLPVTRSKNRRLLVSTLSASSRAAITLLEILVVIAIVGLLIGIIAPALRGAKVSAARSSELNAGRQLMVAYSAYAATFNDCVLPGFADRVPNDPANPNTRPLLAFDEQGHAIDGPGPPPLSQARQRYLWRLAPYLNYNLRGLYVNEQRDVLDRLEGLDRSGYLYQASISPSLGLNSQWMGGDSTKDGFLPPTSPLRKILHFDKYYVTRFSHVQRSDRLMVFGSARGIDPVTNSGLVEGYFRITSPYYHELTGYLWSNAFDASAPPQAHGYLSPRHRGRCVAAFADGHVDVLTPEDLKDMRYWANWADSPDWRLPKINIP